MKQALLVIAVFTLVSCKQNHQQDEGGGADGCACDTGTTYLDSIMIPFEQGHQAVVRYRESIGWHHGDTQILSYTVNANALREYLNREEDIVQLDLYMGIDDSGKKCLVYIGAKTDLGTGLPEEMPYLRTVEGTEQPFVFNHGVPCPKCDKEGIFSHGDESVEVKK